MSKAATAMDPPIRFPPLFPSPAPPRPAGSPGTEGGCRLSRRQTSPRPWGRARTHTHSHAAAATDTISHQRREGRRGDTLPGPLREPRAQQPPARSCHPEPRSLPLPKARSEQLQVWPVLNQLLDAANAGFKTKGRGITLALVLPPGRNPAHDSGHTARLSASRAPAVSPSRTPLLTGAPGLRLPYARGN